MFTIETEREQDGRWIGEVPELPGTLAYGATEAEARRNVEALAFRIMADRLKNGEAQIRPEHRQGETDWGPPVGKEVW